MLAMRSVLVLTMTRTPLSFRRVRSCSQWSRLKTLPLDDDGFQQLLDRQMTHEDNEEVPPAVQHHPGRLQVIFGVFHPCLGFGPHRSTFIPFPAPILPAP